MPPDMQHYQSKLKNYARLTSEGPSHKGDVFLPGATDGGYYWFPVDEESGMPANEDDLAWWALVTEGVAEEKHVEAKIIRDLDVFTCEKPIRDNGFEMALWDAICSGLTASTEMEGKTVAGKVVGPVAPYQKFLAVMISF
ncbi:hypothetical protein B0H11DRAFT_1914850 [Mycena galericulata]|nr:hypothetical protein B0H11DRAFT_1914850 [Mycena galericulata]